jgi:hypothetical protein
MRNRIIFVLVVAAAQANAQEYGGYGVEEFDSVCCNAGECGDLWWTIDNVQAVGSVTSGWASSGLWGTTSIMTNLVVDGRDFTDATKQSFGADAGSGGADTYDVAIISTHGTSNSSSSFVVVGDNNASETCRPNTSAHMLWGTSVGSGDLEVLVLDACQTTQRTVWQANNYVSMRSTNDTFSTLLGFHGNSFDTNWGVGHMSAWASNSRLNGIGDNWLSERTEFWPWSNDDQCATGVVWASSGSVADSMFFNGGFGDRKNTSPKTTSSFYKISGCDPNPGAAL